MTPHAMSAARRTAPYRSDATHRFRVNPVTLIAVTLFLAVLIAEAMFLTLNAPSVAELGPLAAVAGSVP